MTQSDWVIGSSGQVSLTFDMGRLTCDILGKTRPLKFPHKRDKVFLLSRSKFQLQHNVEELDRILQREAAPVVHIRRAVFYTAKRESLDRTVSRFLFHETFGVEIMHLVVQIKWSRVALGALSLAEKDLFTTQFAVGRSAANEVACGSIQLGSRREIENILHLSHMADRNAVENIHSLFDCVNLIAVEIRRPLLELGEVLHRAKASFRSVDLLVLQAA